MAEAQGQASTYDEHLTVAIKHAHLICDVCICYPVATSEPGSYSVRQALSRRHSAVRGQPGLDLV